MRKRKRIHKRKEGYISKIMIIVIIITHNGNLLNFFLKFQKYVVWGVENIELLDQARVALYNSFSDSYLFLSA